MKISEVCERTGLTKRTVRFYIEKGLINPQSQDKNGKEFREYSQEDINLLCAISNLRKLDISVDTIGELIKEPEKICECISNLKSQSREELCDKENIYNTICEIDKDKCGDIYAFSQQIENAKSVKKISPRDLEPIFPQVDNLTIEEKEKAFECFHNELVAKNYISNKAAIIRKRVLIMAAGLLAVFCIIIALSWIPESIDIVKQAVFMITIKI